MHLASSRKWSRTLVLHTLPALDFFDGWAGRWWQGRATRVAEGKLPASLRTAAGEERLSVCETALGMLQTSSALVQRMRSAPRVPSELAGIETLKGNAGSRYARAPLPGIALRLPRDAPSSDRIADYPSDEKPSTSQMAWSGAPAVRYARLFPVRHAPQSHRTCRWVHLYQASYSPARGRLKAGARTNALVLRMLDRTSLSAHTSGKRFQNLFRQVAPKPPASTGGFLFSAPMSSRLRLR